jgi:hypothetical protein
MAAILSLNPSPPPASHITTVLKTLFKKHTILASKRNYQTLFVGTGTNCAFPRHIRIAEFAVPDWGDKVDSGIGLSYLPATGYTHRLVGRYDNLMPELTISPSKGL